MTRRIATWLRWALACVAGLHGGQLGRIGVIAGSVTSPVPGAVLEVPKHHTSHADDIQGAVLVHTRLSVELAYYVMVVYYSHIVITVCE